MDAGSHLDPLPLRATPEREFIFKELHARPHYNFTGPAHVLHLAVLTDDTRERADREKLDELVTALTLAVFLGTERHRLYSKTYPGLGELVLTWERHNEYCTFSFLLHALKVPFVPFGFDIRRLLPEAWLESLASGLLVATRVSVMSCETASCDPAAIEHYFEGHNYTGCSIMGGTGQYYSCFRLHSNGMGRVAIFANNMSSEETGRSLQRVLAVEDLYHMTLLPMPVAREIRPVLNQYEERLNREMTRVSTARDLNEERETLEALLRLAADVEHLRSRVSTRFPGSVAYLLQLDQRLSELREQKIEHILLPSRFVLRRIRPAVEMFQYMLGQISSISVRVSNAASLMQTRIELSMEEQNQKLLASVDRRADLQIRLQETVEGLSVIVLSYYSIGIVSYLLKAMKGAGLHVNADVATGVSVPVVLFLVWFLVRKMKERLVHRHPG